MKHEVLYHRGPEVVCTCGGYFRTQPISAGIAETGLQAWAAHIAQTAQNGPETALGGDGSTARVSPVIEGGESA